MIRWITLAEAIELHRLILLQSGGSEGVRDRGALESAIAQPQATFGGAELYSTLSEKAAALGFSLISNHPFVDGNKRIGHAAMETFLLLNGWELTANVDEQERTILGVASGHLTRAEFGEWVRSRMTQRAAAPRLHDGEK